MFFLLFLGLALIAFAFVAAIVIACILRNWGIAVIAAAGAVLGAVIVILGVCWLYGPADVTSQAEMNKGYEVDFGAPPPPGIQVLKCRQFVFGDSGGQWLLLKATPEEIDKHIAMGFKPETYDADFAETGGKVPDWWQPRKGIAIYKKEDANLEGGWHSSYALIGVDREQGLIWFSVSKMD